MRHLAPAVDRALARAGIGAGELTDIVVGTGPGPFTGLRVGIVTGRVLALTSGARLHGVCSLDAIARLAGEYDVVGLNESDPGSLRSGFTNQTHYLEPLVW